jgi:hypothetical protein
VDLIEATEQTSGSQALLSLWLLSRVVPELRRELQDIAAVLRGQERQDVAQVRPRLDAMELAAGDEAGRDGVPFCAVVADAPRRDAYRGSG